MRLKQRPTNGQLFTFLEMRMKPTFAGLYAAPGTAPIAIHAVGHYGIGRRTFLRKTLSGLYPRAIEAFIEIPLYRYEGAEEFYRRLYEQHVVSSLEEAVRNFEQFGAMSLEEQVEKLADLLVELRSLKGIPLSSMIKAAPTMKKETISRF